LQNGGPFVNFKSNQSGKRYKNMVFWLVVSIFARKFEVLLVFHGKWHLFAKLSKSSIPWIQWLLLSSPEINSLPEISNP
jgi:hypothetical protein